MISKWQTKNKYKICVLFTALHVTQNEHTKQTKKPNIERIEILES